MQLSDMRGRVAQRLNEGGGSVFYPAGEIDARLNEANRFFVLLTLSLEVTASWTIPAATPFHHMLTYFPDWIVPLRLVLASGAKVRPAEVEELTAADVAWLNSPGTPTRYATNGCDLIALDHQPAAPLAVNLTYARAPQPLALDTDVPEIPAPYHPRLVEYAVYALRQVEGGQELAKAMPLFGSFLDGATVYGDYIRSRNQASRYDAMPFELGRYSRKALMQMSGAKSS